MPPRSARLFTTTTRNISRQYQHQRQHRNPFQHTIPTRPTTKMSMSTSSTTPKPNTETDKTPYLLTTYIPKTHTATVMQSICKTGAGSWPGGLYAEAYFTTPGTGQFRCLEGSNPAIGKVGEVEIVEEDKVEIVCVGRGCAVRAVKCLKEVHPYEQVAYFVVRAEEI